VASLRKWLLSGLLVLVSLIVTLWVLDWAATTLAQTLSVRPADRLPDALPSLLWPGAGVALALAAGLFLGARASGTLGDRLTNGWRILPGSFRADTFFRLGVLAVPNLTGSPASPKLKRAASFDTPSSSS